MAKTHKVKQGDTLLKIADMYNTTLEQLVKMNGVTTVSRGMGIKIPDGITGRVTARAGMNGQVKNITRVDLSNSMFYHPEEKGFFGKMMDILNRTSEPEPSSGLLGVRGYNPGPKVQMRPAAYGIDRSGISGSVGQNVPRFAPAIQGTYISGNYFADPLNFIPSAQGFYRTVTGQEAPVNRTMNQPLVSPVIQYSPAIGPLSVNQARPSLVNTNYPPINYGQTGMPPVNTAYPTYSMNQNPNASYNALFPYYYRPGVTPGPMTGLGLLPTTQQPQAQPQAPSGFYVNDGGGLVQEGIRGDKWEFKNGVTVRAGKRRGMPRYAQQPAPAPVPVLTPEQQMYNQVPVNQVPVLTPEQQMYNQVSGVIEPTSWRIGF